MPTARRTTTTKPLPPLPVPLGDVVFPYTDLVMFEDVVLLGTTGPVVVEEEFVFPGSG